MSNSKENTSTGPQDSESARTVSHVVTEAGPRVGSFYMDGWIKLHRKVRDNWIWRDPIKFQRWIDILLEVNHEGAKVPVGLEVIEVKRGQSIRSLENWGKRWGISKGAARNFLKMLESDAMITHENLTKTTRITVCNYETYQTSAHDGKTHGERKKNAKKTDGDTNKNDKNEKKVGMTARQEKILKFNPVNFDEKTQQEWIDKNFPRVQMLKYRLIAPELADLIKKYTKEKVVQTLKEMENKKDLLSKYIDAGLTLGNWLKNSKT